MTSLAFNIKITIEVLINLLSKLSESEFEHVINKMFDQKKNALLTEGYKKLSKLKFDDIGTEDDWLPVENEALDITEKELL